MRILWFIHIAPKAALLRTRNLVGGTGFWIHSLIDEISHIKEITLAVAYEQRGACEQFESDGVMYYPIRRKYKAIGPMRTWQQRVALRGAVEVIKKFQPELIHVHGTESVFGLIKAENLTDIPVIVSLQGIMSQCALWAWGDKSLPDMLPLQGLDDAKLLFPTLMVRKRFESMGRREKRILRSVDGVLGRTDWDRAFVSSLGCKIPYYHVDELMRPEFFRASWSLPTCTRHRVYTSGRLTFAKGMHTFLNAMFILKRDYPDMQIRIAGGNSPLCEPRYLQRQVYKLGLEKNVDFLGWIPSPKIIEELKAAHVYANASFIENSPNSVCEAMLMGVPSVCSVAGGIPSLMTDHTEGLLVRPGEPALLAFAIRELFENDDLSVELGLAAQRKAKQRHSPQKILHDLLETYFSFS